MFEKWDPNKKVDVKQKDLQLEKINMQRYSKIILSQISSFKEMQIQNFAEGLQYRIITSKSFNAISVINYFIDTEDVHEIYLAIYRINMAGVEYLIKYAKQGIPLHIIISSFFRENHKYENWTRTLNDFSLQNKNMNLKYAWNHAKIALIKTKDKYIVFEGSGNLSDNARIEQYLIENNREVYEFHKSWMNEIG